MKDIKVILKWSAKEDYLTLCKTVDTEKAKNITKTNNQTLLDSINQKIDQLKTNPCAGRAVKKSQIPKIYQNKAVTNLWVLNLANFWRIIYTINTNEVCIFCFILEFGDHNKYNKLFGFKKK